MTQTQATSSNNRQLTIIISAVAIIVAIILIFVFAGNNNPTTQDLSFTDEPTATNDANQLQSDQFNLKLEQQNNNTQNQPQSDTNNQPQKEDMNDINKTNMPKPEMTIDQDKQYLATMDTSQGTIKLELFADQTPITVNNFVYLARQGFYDNLTFHRVIPDFMIQGGCPKGDGTGSPGYQFQDEDNPAPLVKGSLAMANSGPNTNGSQFFIVTADATPWLDGKHTHFGKVVTGMDVVEKIEQTKTGMRDKPVKPIIIESVTIEEK
jgi:cyclophilin family peptidyl-prolyl cis-trans isomerase